MDSDQKKRIYNFHVPNDWDVKEFVEAGIIVIDGDRGTNYPSQGDFSGNGYCLFMNAKNVTNTGFSFEEKNFISKEKDQKLRKGKLNLFDLVMTTRGSLGHIGYYDNSVPFEHLRINSGMVLIRNTNSKIDTDFVYKYCGSAILQNHILKIAFGSAQSQLTVKEIVKFKIPLPPLPEQRAIAKVLGAMDKAINANNQLIAQKELRKKWLMQNLLTGKKRLEGFSGEITTKIIRPLLNEVSTRNKELKVTNVLSVTNSRGFINQSDQFDRAVASKDLSNYKIVRKGQFAYNPSRVNVGSLDLLREFEVGILSPMYVVFDTNPKELNKDFFFYQLKSSWFNGHIPMFVQGSVRDSLSFDGLCGMKFFVPSLDEQTAIAQVLQSADKELNLLNAKNGHIIPPTAD